MWYGRYSHPRTIPTKKIKGDHNNNGTLMFVHYSSSRALLLPDQSAKSISKDGDGVREGIMEHLKYINLTNTPHHSSRAFLFFTKP